MPWVRIGILTHAQGTRFLFSENASSSTPRSRWASRPIRATPPVMAARLTTPATAQDAVLEVRSSVERYRARKADTPVLSLPDGHDSH